MKKAFFFPILFSMIHVVAAQNFERLPPLAGNLADWYSTTVQDIAYPIMQGTHFYNSADQVISPDQNPFYSDGWDQKGSIFFEGRPYDNMNIIYNTSEDLLLVWSWEMGVNGNQSLLINQAKIDSFIIHKDKFLSFKYAYIGDTGFYRKLFQGKHIGFYAKEKKQGALEELAYEFKEKRQYYIRYQGETFNFKKIASLYSIFPGHKKQIKQYFKDNFSWVQRDNEVVFQLILNHIDLNLL